MTIGERIAEERKLAGLTQKELGTRTGIDPSTIRKYESGRLNPKIETIKRIAEVLNINWYDLYEGLDSQSSNNAALDQIKWELGAITVENGKIKEISYDDLLEEQKKTGKVPKLDPDLAVFADFLKLNDAGQFVALQSVLEVIDRRLNHSNALKFKYYVELLQKEAYDSIKNIATPNETSNSHAFEALQEVYDRVKELAQLPIYQKPTDPDKK